MFQMTGVFAEFERAMIRERVKAGLNRAKENGKLLGRPRIEWSREAISSDLNAGVSIREIAAKHCISIGKTHTAIEELRRDIKAV